MGTAMETARAGCGTAGACIPGAPAHGGHGPLLLLLPQSGSAGPGACARDFVERECGGCVARQGCRTGSAGLAVFSRDACLAHGAERLPVLSPGRLDLV